MIDDLKALQQARPGVKRLARKMIEKIEQMQNILKEEAKPAFRFAHTRLQQAHEQQQGHQEDKQSVVREKLADTWTSHGKVTQNIVQNSGGLSNL
ncbi:hypothetical protein DFQ28_001163, partial [Apophysomyces sp. BC1034]